MKKKIQRVISGVLATMFVGQVMIYGDGSSQGIVHAETITEIKESLQLSENADKLHEEYEKAVSGLGNVEYFSYPDTSLMMINETSENRTISFADSLTVTGCVQKGVVSGYDTKDNTPVYVRIFNGNWEEITYTKLPNGGEYEISASGSDVYHVKFECDGYLPFYLKDFGTGKFTVGSGESLDTVTLVPGDTTYNYYNANQWSDDVIDGNDASYVASCLGATRGDSNFNPSMDADGDNVVSNADLDAFCAFYEKLGEDEYYELSQHTQNLDINRDNVINDYDYEILSDIVSSNENVNGYILPDLADGDGYFTAADLEAFKAELDTARTVNSSVYIYNHEMTGDIYVNAEDFTEGLDTINAMCLRKGRSENYFEYMDKDNDGIISDYDVSWFNDAYTGDLYWDHAFKRNLTVLESGAFPYSFNLHDTNLNLNGCTVFVGDCMSFTTDMPQFWNGTNGATLDVNGGSLIITNNLVFRTASPDGWSGNAGQLMNINGGEVTIGNCFDFGQANCYDTILMTNDADRLYVGGNWTYITLQDMEGKWTAGQIWFCGPHWNVNEASGEKAIYSSGTQSIIFGYEGGKQTVLWDNPETYIDNEDGSLNTLRTFNFDYEYGILFLKEFTAENYWFRPWWRPYDEPDYTLYRKGWEIGDGVHIATGNYSKSFTDLSIASPGVKSDFVRTYNSMSEEEGSFGIGWDFNIDVSKIVIPAQGYYQVVLPDGSNTTFKDNGNGGFECLNAHSTMTKSGDEYTITNAAQSQYHFNADGELDWVKDANGNILKISAKSNDQRTVTDSTGRTYTIQYKDINGHNRIEYIKDNAGNRTVTYSYNGNAQLISATSVSGGTEKYEYDGNGRLCKITNCYNEVTDQISYNDNGSVNWLTNSAGLKQEYTYDKAFKQTGLKEYDGEKLVKTFTYDYDEKYAVKTNTVETDGQTYEVDKITYNMIDGENKYDEMSESVDIMGNTTKYERDANGNVTKTINADKTYTLARYNDKNMPLVQVDENKNVVICEYDESGVNVLKQYQSLTPVSDADKMVSNSFDLSTIDYTNYAMTVYTYYAASETASIAGLVRTITDPEGNVTEYTYGTSGYAKGLPVKVSVKDGNTVVNTVEYEYNAQLQVSKEKTSVDISKNVYAVKEYEYDKFNNVTKVKDYGTGSTAAVTISEYDKLSRKTAEYSPNFSADKSHGTYATYYPSGAVKTQTDALGNVTSFEYDAYGNVTAKINPDGTVNIVEYDGLQREKATYFKETAESEKQILTSTGYEFENHSFNIYTGTDNSYSESYNGLRTFKITYISAEKQVMTETLADFRGNTVEEKVNDEVKRTNAYYSNGQLARQTDALGNTTKYEYNFLNKLTKTETPFDNENISVTTNEYDKNGNVIKTIQKIDNNKNSITQNQYNAMGLLEKVTLSDGTANGAKNISKYFYNNAGVQIKMYTGMSSESDTSYLTTNYEYDSWMRAVRTTDSTGYNSGTITYDLNGNVLTNTDANGNVTTNTYDALNRVISSKTVNPKDSSKNVSKSYTYDNMGRITKAENNDLTTAYIYDALGRKTKETEYKNGYSAFKGFFYEGVSQYTRQQIVGIEKLLMYSYTSYEYDDEMRVVKVMETGEDTVSYTYDANGNKKTETLANGVVSTYTYNKANRITKIENKNGNSNISSYEYSYYLDGSDACKVRNENGIIETTEYEYDGLKRLTEESVKVGSNTTDTYSYEYDDYGNRSKMTATGTEDYVTEYSYSDANGSYTALLQKEVKTVESDENPFTSETKQTVYTYDANGNQITKTAEGKTETNTYDGLNQLIGFTDGETTASYKYNVSGLRYEKTVNGQTINHVWDGNQQIVADVIDNQFYEANCYIRGTNLVAKYNYRNGEKSEYTYYTQNAHGDVVNLTDETGKVTKTYTYDAFGVEKNIDENDINAFRYCGEYYDAETGTIYLRARYYNPSNGRFTQRDSYAGKLNDPLSLNLYTYCQNNPLIFTDPSGHNAFTKWCKDRLVDLIEIRLNADRFAESAIKNTGKELSDNSEGFAVAGVMATCDGILPVGDVAAGVKISSILIAAGIVGTARTAGSFEWIDYSSRIRAKDDADAIEKDISFPRLPDDTVIYRWGSNSPGNLTPKDKDRNTGLSFSLVPPVGKDYVETTIATVNSTGILIANRDGATHVSIVPNPSIATLDEWIDEGKEHICTQTLQSIVTKHKKNE